MKLNSFNEKIHSLVIVLMSMISILVFFFVEKIKLALPLYLFLNVIYLINGIRLERLFKIIFISIIFSGLCTFLPLIFPNHQLDIPPFITILFLKIPRSIYEIQKIIFFRVILISSISMGMIYVVNFEKVIIFLMNKKYLSTKWGYSLLLAFNSISALKSELERIQINAKFRNIPLYERANLIFPLLVYAIRHADRGAMALVTRGLTEDKKYYFDTSLKMNDKKIGILFLLVFAFTVLINFI